MDYGRKEYIVSVICAGYIRCEVSSGEFALIHSPNIHEKYIAEEVYAKAYDKAIEDNLYFDEEIVVWLRENGFWSDLDEKRLEQIPKDIEKTKLSMFESQFDIAKRENLRSFLRKAEVQLNRTLRKRHAYDHLTCSGFANYAKQNWIIENCTKYENGKPYDFTYKSISEVLANWQESQLSEEIYREIARTDPWRGIWAAHKRGVDLFGRIAAEYTQPQKGLCAWSSMYDSISESQESPSDEVIQDDDLLDGWLIKQRKSSEQRKSQQQADMSLPENISNKGEVFLMTGNKTEDIERVANMNDPLSRSIVKSRLKTVKEADGAVVEADLPDVRQDIKFAGQAQLKEHLRGS